MSPYVELRNLEKRIRRLQEERAALVKSNSANPQIQLYDHVLRIYHRRRLQLAQA